MPHESSHVNDHAARPAGRFAAAAHRICTLQTFIQKRKWMSETVFLELFSLSSCLPGPTSTQVSFALGAVKKGIPGGLLGGALFQYPGLFMMAAIGVGAANFLQDGHWWTRAAVDGAIPRFLERALQLPAVGFQLRPDMQREHWCNVQRDLQSSVRAGARVHSRRALSSVSTCVGLAAVAVALVAVAAKGLVTKTAKDTLTVFIMLISAALSFTFQAPWLFPVLIVSGGLATLVHNAYIKKDMALPVRAPDALPRTCWQRLAVATLWQT